LNSRRYLQSKICLAIVSEGVGDSWILLETIRIVDYGELATPRVAYGELVTPRIVDARMTESSLIELYRTPHHLKVKLRQEILHGCLLVLSQRVYVKLNRWWRGDDLNSFSILCSIWTYAEPIYIKSKILLVDMSLLVEENKYCKHI
jgi:hypothetical protein